MADQNSTNGGSNGSDTDHFKWKAISWDWWILCQTGLFFLGLIGNSCIIYIYTMKFRKFSSMNRLIRGLAIADLCTSLLLAPIPVIDRVPPSVFGHLYCKVIYTNNLMWISIVSSVFTLTMMSIDQCLAVLYPLQNHLMFSKSRSKVIILGVWVASFLTNAFTYFAAYRKADGTCTFNLGGPVLQGCIGVFIFSLEYFIPMVIMVATHLLTLRCLRAQADSLMQHARSGSSERTRRDSIMIRAHQRVLKMLLVVVLTFIFCWTADQVSFLLFNLGILEFNFLYSNIYHGFVVLAFVNSCANPFIYTASNPQFRRALKTFWDSRETSSDDSLGKGHSSARNSTAITATTALNPNRVYLQTKT